MNTTYRIIWSKVRQAYIVTGELAKTAGKGSSRRRSLLAAAVAGLLGVSAPLQAEVAPGALPQGGQISAGQGSMAQLGNQLRVQQQSQQLITNWQSFSIGSGAKVEFVQPGSDSVALNRVLGANPSELMGQLQANGRVYLVNPNGVLVGADARIDAASFIATTADIDNAAFLAQGDLTFSGGSDAGVVNLGVIRASAGDVVLVGSRVVNQGTIEAPEGRAALAAATEFVYSPLGDEAIRVVSASDEEKGGVGVDNAGLLDAAQAQLLAADGNLYELAVNQSGVVRATGIERRGGRVVLTADGGTLRLDGTISAHNADGSGGEVLVGGDFHGANPEVANAAQVEVGQGAVIDVSATAAQGDGGTAVVWADQLTDFAGRIDGRAGALGGDGGTAEVSGKQVLNYQGRVDLTAPVGETGVLLLDPSSLAINATGPDSAGVQLSSSPLTYGQQNGTTTSILSVATLEAQLALSSVILDTSDTGPTLTDFVNTTTYTTWTDGSIEVNAPLSWSSGSTLTFNSGNSIYVNADIDAGTNGSIVFGLGSEEAGTQIIGNCVVPSRAAELVVDAAAAITANAVIIKPGTISAASSSYATLGNPGRIAIAGALNVATLEIDYPVWSTSTYGYAGINGAVTIDNPANRIDVLSGVTDSGVFGGDFKLVDSAGGLTVTGNLFGYAGARIDIVTQGDLTLASGTRITTGIDNYGVANAPYSDIALAARGGAFINNAGANAVEAAGTGRFLIYSATPSSLLSGGLLATPVYNKNYDLDAPAGITQSGDRFLYELAPVLTVTADSLSRVYGDANPTLTYQVSGLVGGDTAAAVYSGSPSLSTTLDAGSAAGSYTGAIAVSQGGLTLSDYNYGFSGVAGDLTITQAPLTITADNASRLYGAADPTFTASYLGLVAGETAADLPGLTLTSDALVGSPVGNGYTITPAGAVNANYAISYQSGALTINPAPLTVTADAASRLYGAADPNFSATLSGLVAGDTAADITGLTLTSDALVDSPVGSGYVVIPAGGSNPNYSVSYVSAPYTITPAPLQVTANDAARLYGAADPAFSATLTGFVNGDNASVLTSPVTFSTSAVVGSSVGSYSITPAGASADNYAINFVNGTLTINPAALTIRADNASRLYGAADPIFTASYLGLVAGDTAADLTGLTLTSDALVGSPVGSGYTITPAGAVNANYSISYQPGSLTITPAPLTISADNAAILLGDPLPDPATYTATFAGLVGGDLASDYTASLAITNQALDSTTAGGFAITPGGVVDPNYAITFVDGTLTIGTQILTVTADDMARLYGEANPAFTASLTGFVNGDDVNVLTSPVTFSTSAVVGSSVGTYTITPGGATATNYDMNFVNGTLTINPAALTIRADNASRLYGAADPTFTASYLGLVAGDTAADLPGLTLTSDALVGSPVGSYTITPAGAVNANYSISYQSGALTITPAPLTVTAAAASRLYGAADPTFSATLSGLVAGDTAADITGITLGSDALVGSPVGSGYVVIPAGGSNTNYSYSYVSAPYTITPAPLQVTANDATRLYGAADPAFTASYAGFVNGDDSSVLTTPVSFSTMAVANSPVGTYAIVPSGAAATNYNFSYVNGTLTVNPAALTIRANNASRLYGATNPAFSATYIGLVAGDTAADITGLAFSTNATAGSSVGGYAIHPVNAANANYTIQLVDGTLTVDPAPLTVTANSASREYGAADPAFSATYAGLVLSDTPADITGIGFATDAATASPVGASYTITPSGGDNPNYSYTYVDGGLTITPAPLLITANDASRIYGDPNPAFSASYTGLRAGDTSADILGLAYATATSDAYVGSYALTPSGASNANYSIAYQPGQLTITPAPLSVSVDSAQRVYGDANPAFTATVSGLKAGDNAYWVGLAYQTDAVQASPVGDYLVNPTITSLNYTLTGQAGTLTVTPRPITIVVADATRYYGEANPTFTLANSDSNLVPAIDPLAEVVELRTTADRLRSVAGTYPIDVTLVNPNYTLLSATPGTLTVDPFPLHVVIDNVTRTYGDPNPFFFSYNLVGAPVPDGVILPINFNFGTQVATDARSNVGFYQIVYKGGFDPNRFTMASVEPGVMTVLPRPVTLVIDSTGKSVPAGLDLRRDVSYAYGIDFSARLEGALPGDSVERIFPDLTYRLFEDRAQVIVASANYADIFIAPDASAFTDGFAAAPSLIPSEYAYLPIPAATGIIFISAGDTVTLGIAPAGHYGYPSNYAVTAVRPGRYSLTHQLQLSKSNSELLALAQNQQPLVIRSQSDYRSNAIYYLQDNADRAVSIITDYLNAIDDPRSNELYMALFGDGDMDPAKIRAWMAGAASDEEKRLLLAAPMLNYILALKERDPSTYTGGEQNLVAAVEAEMADQYRDLSQTVLDAQAAWHAQKGNAPTMTDLYDGVEPYGEFIRDGLSDYVVGAFSGSAVAGMTALIAGGTAATVGAAAAAGAAASAIFVAHKVAAAAGSAGGPVGFAVAVVVTVTVIRTAELIESENEHRDFNAVVDSGNSYHALSDLSLDLNDESMQTLVDRMVFGASLNKMLGL